MKVEEARNHVGVLARHLAGVQLAAEVLVVLVCDVTVLGTGVCCWI